MNAIWDDMGYSIYSLGSNGSGQLGLQHKDDCSEPERVTIDFTSPPKQIVAGGNHTVVLRDDGNVRAFGDVDHSHGLSTAKLTAKLVSATWAATIVAGTDGLLYSLGEGANGELGLGEGITQTPNLQSIPDFPPEGAVVVRIASCMAHTVAVLSNGEAWGWGNGRKGQLGELAGVIWSPRKIACLPFPASDVVCGKDFTCILGNRSKGEIHLLGLGKNDRFGLRASFTPAESNFRRMAASWGSVHVLHQDGRLHGYGRNDHGQLPPRNLPAIQSFAAGSEHCVAISKAGKVLAWGWGEHGNCGEPTDPNGDVKNCWNEIGVPDRPVAVFAGCATTFVVIENGTA